MYGTNTVFSISLRTLFLSSFLVSSLFIVGCTSMTNTEKAVKHARESAPINNRQELKSRLRIPEERLEAIGTGEEGKARVNKFLSSGSGGTEFDCIEGIGCMCFGDDDCNFMYETICADHATNGDCTGEPPICTCNP